MSHKFDGYVEIEISQPYARELARQVNELGIENGRLRTALEAIANYCDHCHETAHKALQSE